ncbi:hypothetical protein TNCV_2084591 [Trichonephila clavipes]|uniref:Uncharacterized protein n=1 Tax=Trichonephila clavipes TaxID=2585209 RepID=A0A8X6V7E7_TRICX|nr:hypothetical protein TNCV_2084591 [Trichonephila clavipes]
MIPSDSPIPFNRLLFPTSLPFAMTINKSQGQTMKICGLRSNTFRPSKSYVMQNPFRLDVARITIRLLVLVTPHAVDLEARD